MKYILPFLLLACSESRLVSTDKDPNTEDDDTDSTIETDTDLPSDPGDCQMETLPPEQLAESDACPSIPEGGFTPVVEWSLVKIKGASPYLLLEILI